MRNQLQRAAASATTNLTEGFEQIGEGEKLQFWNIARASAGELKSSIYGMHDNQPADATTVQNLKGLATEVTSLT